MVDLAAVTVIASSPTGRPAQAGRFLPAMLDAADADLGEGGAARLLLAWLGTVAPDTIGVNVVMDYVDGRQLTYGWHPDELTVDRLTEALRDPPTIPAVDGSERSACMWRIGPLTLFAGKEVGPPAWRLPRVQFRGPPYPAVRVGWRYTAYEAAATITIRPE